MHVAGPARIYAVDVDVCHLLLAISRLNLRLLCPSQTPARDALDIWPPLPLIIQEYYGVLNRWNGTSGVDNIIAALEHNDRVCEIRLRHLTTTSELKYVTDSAAMFTVSHSRS
jgi:hypothetical protein